MECELSKVKSLNNFSFKLFQKLNNDKSENFFISPFSISTALLMAYSGARNETETQLKKLLCLENLTNDQIYDLNREYMNNLINIGNNVSLNVANKIYPKQGYELKKEFVENLNKNFKSEAQELDFSKREESAKLINDWVSEQTKEKINNLINPNILNDLTRLILVNAIYFKGSWLNKFDKEQTYKEDFYLNNGTTVKTDMMKLLNKKFLLKTNPGGLKALSCEFPYVGKSIAMTIILPHEGVKIEEVENQLNAETLNQVLIQDMPDGKVHAYIPKFKLEFKSELSEALSNMGAPLAFDQVKADFSGITSDPNGLYISKVIHQAVVEVNEEGTEAAAATGVVMMTRCAMIHEFPPVEFKCNRPFLFIIHDKLNNGVLFFGKFVKP